MAVEASSKPCPYWQLPLFSLGSSCLPSSSSLHCRENQQLQLPTDTYLLSTGATISTCFPWKSRSYLQCSLPHWSLWVFECRAKTKALLTSSFLRTTSKRNIMQWTWKTVGSKSKSSSCHLTSLDSHLLRTHGGQPWCRHRGRWGHADLPCHLVHVVHTTCVGCHGYTDVHVIVVHAGACLLPKMWWGLLWKHAIARNGKSNVSDLECWSH